MFLLNSCSNSCFLFRKKIRCSISKNEICDFYIAGADAVACVKSTCYNLRKANYGVNVLSDCVTSYDKRKIDEMLRYYESKGSKIICLNDLLI
jgi:nicotinamidase-related amidase